MSYGLFNMPPPIRVYPPNETAFTTNGLRCLFPQSAEVTLREQQAHSIRLVHPVDDDGAWKALQLHNILYVPIEKRGEMTFQPMRIYKIQKQRQTGGKLSITVDAKHVFYDLNSVIVQACTISAAACQAAIGSAFSSVYRPTANAQACDAFIYSSDISTTASAQYDNVTLTAALIGDESSIASLYGGELYVDGFRFSINSRMEGSLDNAFTLSYAVNMVGITATYDTDAQYSAVVGLSGATVQTRIADASSIGLPFDRTIYAKFSYKSGTPAQQFSNDLDKYADNAKQVNASYQVTFADLSTFDEYSGFANLSTFEVGDTGTVYDEFLEINTHQKIVEKKIDVLTQTVLSVTLANIPASITQKTRYANTVTNTMTAAEKDNSVLSAEIAALNVPKKTASGAPPVTFTTALAQYAETWAVYGASGGVGVNRINLTDFSAMSEGYFQGQQFVENIRYLSSDFIPVDPTKSYTKYCMQNAVGSSSSALNCYAADKTFISTITGESVNQNFFHYSNIPSNCKYVRYTHGYRSGASPTSVYFGEGVEEPSAPFEPYSQYAVTISVYVNGTKNVSVGISQKLYSGDYIRRTEGGAAVLHLENDSSGNPLSDPVETPITMPVIALGKGSQSVTVAGTVQPSSVEIVYR